MSQEDGNTGDQPPSTPNERRLQSEIDRNAAEQRKLTLEADEVEKRLSQTWWHMRLTVFIQLLVGAFVAAGLLAVWTLGFFQPILSKEQDIAELDNTLLKIKNELKTINLEEETKNLEGDKALLVAQIMANELKTKNLEEETTKLGEDKSILVARIMENQLKTMDLEEETTTLGEEQSVLVAQIVENQLTTTNLQEEAKILEDEKRFLLEQNQVLRDTNTEAVTLFIELAEKEGLTDEERDRFNSLTLDAKSAAQALGKSEQILLGREFFTIDFGSIVADGKPERGAGNIETGGAQDIYTLQIDATQIAFFDELFPTCRQPNFSGDILWELKDESGTTFPGWEEWLSDCSNERKNVPLEPGAWTITVFGEEAATGTYRFQIWSVPRAKKFDIVVGDIVEGDIEIPAARNIYRFQIDAEHQTALFDFAELFPTCDEGGLFGDILWELKDESGTPFVDWDDDLDACSNQNKNVALEPGAWTLTVFGEEAATGTYRFKIIKKLE